MSSPVLSSGVRVVYFVLLYASSFLVPCCEIYCYLRIETMFGSSLSQVVYSRSYLIFLFILVQWLSTCLNYVNNMTSVL
jgi:hypothetical protein